MAKIDKDTLLKVYEQNWVHVRHIESSRMVYLNVYVAILSAVFYAFTSEKVDYKYLVYIVSFLLVFSIINYLLSIKMEAVIADYVGKNGKIVSLLKMEDYAGLRVKGGMWKFIRLKHLLPVFYAGMSLALVVFIGVGIYKGMF